jgi:superfamily II DNA or RNA helicase
MKELRAWQREAWATYERATAEGRRELLWEATPGAGKTTAGLLVAKEQIEHGAKAVVVVPTSHLKTQWATAAHRMGINLDANYAPNQGLSREYQGAVLTYQQIAHRPKAYLPLARHAITILDEVHHAGDMLAWGSALRLTMKDARFILALSGTPFRSDNNPIPFVRYEDNTSAPDYSYTYAEAIRDKVCRPMAFFTYGGEVQWYDGEVGVTANFTDELSHGDASRRLRAALSPSSGWVQTMLRDAHQMLLDVRREHAQAKGLLVGIDQSHARELATTLSRLTGKTPVVALSDDKGASARIKKFTSSDDMWLVACNMVSEGVDIPNLRVGVYATNVAAKMYFRQYIGRMVRRTATPHGAQVAYCYLPADKRLQLLAEEVEAEQRHQLQDRPIAPSSPTEGKAGDAGNPRPLFSVGVGTNSGMAGVIVHGQQLGLFGGDLRTIKQAVHQTVAARTTPDTELSPEPVTLTERKKELANNIKGLIGAYHATSKKSHAIIRAELNKKQGVTSQSACTEAQLQERIRILRGWLR